VSLLPTTMLVLEFILSDARFCLLYKKVNYNFLTIVYFRLV